MAKNVIRQDVVQIGFEVEKNPLKELTEELNKIKKFVSGVADNDGLSEVAETAKKAQKSVKGLTDEVKKTTSATSGIKKLKDNIDKTVKSLTGGEKGAKGFVNAVKNISKTSVTKLANGLKTVKTKLSEVSKKADGVYSGLKKVAGVSFKALGAGMVAGATAAGAIVKKSVDSFADYEQLVGGVDTLFGKASGKVQENAKKAFATAGLSANTYMETVTSFSASLINSVGGDTQKAADMSDMALRDMSDNANKMGTDMDMIMGTYQSLSRGNFAMLDNLKLGYGGTKEEMKRLIKEASKLDKSVKNGDMSFGNMVKAIHAVQNEMGITGTTSKEASTTITGSLGALKGAWSNTLTSLVTGGDYFDESIANLVESAKTFGKNIMPAIRGALSGLGSLIKELAPIIAKELPGLVEEILPPLISAAWDLTKGLIQALPSIVSTVIKSIVDLFGKKFPALKKIGNSLTEHAGGIAKAILGIFVAFKGIKLAKGIFSIFGKGGGGGQKGGFVDTLKNTFTKLGKTKTGVIAKGLANLAIIVGGVTLLTAACVSIMLLVSKLGNAGQMLQMIVVIGAMGLIGSALAKLAGIVGKIPVATVAKGLANIAIIVAGMSALFLLVGAVSLLNFDYTKMLTIVKIIAVLGAVGSALALFAGVVGLIPIPVVLMGLANIGLVLAGMSALIVAFGALTKIKGFTEFIEKGGAILVKIMNIIGEMVGSLVGGVLEGIANSLPAVGESLGKFGENVKPLFEAMSGIDMGGVGQFFKALVSLLAVATGNSIVEGIKNFFGGDDESSLAKLGTELSNFAGNSKGFFTTVASLKEDSFTKATNMFKCLAKVKDLPSAGKKGTTNLSAIATDLGSFHSKAGSFFTNVESYNLAKVNELWSTLGGADTLTSGTLKKVGENIDEVVKKVSGLPKKMGEGLKKSGGALTDAFVSIWKEAVKDTAKPINKLIAGANWILKEFGSKKTILSWTPYAKGTNGHKGGNALVNDGRGAELVQMPNGKTFIPQGRNVFIPNAPRGMKVASAEQTARMMGRKSPTFRYAKGTGDIDIWSYMDNASGLISAVSKKYVNYGGVKGIAVSIGKSMVSTVEGQMSAWAKKLFDEFGALSIDAYNPSKGVSQWRSTVIRALKMEGQYSEANVARTLMQMQTESGGNPRAINLWDSNAKKGVPSKGLMQVIDPTFRAYARPGFNKNIYDPLSNILASIRYAVSRYGSLARAYRGVGYENGGLVTRTGTIAENPLHPEWVIPTDPSKRNRALSLYRQAGRSLGYSPESDATSFSSKTSIEEHNTYSPQFNLTIGGTSDDRAMERKVKRWISESMDEFFDSMARRNPRIREV